MKTDTKNKILDFLAQRGRVAVRDIAGNFDISRQAVYKQLNSLLAQGKVEKIGKPPKVFYSITKPKGKDSDYFDIEEKTRWFIEERFLDVTSEGEIKYGWPAFVGWCTRREQDVSSSAFDYVNILRRYDNLRKNGLLDGMLKMKNTFEKVYLNHIFYLDFYAIERFGKTKLGNLLLYAKQSQDRKLMKQISFIIKPSIERVIREYKIDAIGFVPPTVKREVQFMKELEKNLALSSHAVKITKIKTSVVVPQKTLNKLEDRVENAKKTFVVEGDRIFRNILLVDDAVGSGATLNEIASQVRQRGIVSGIIVGLAITGSVKGFDVISEV